MLRRRPLNITLIHDTQQNAENKDKAISLSHACYMPVPCTPSLFIYPNNIRKSGGCL
jgi:hypothetical protein